MVLYSNFWRKARRFFTFFQKPLEIKKKKQNTCGLIFINKKETYEKIIYN